MSDTTTAKVDWFELGWAVYKEGAVGGDLFPPLNDMEAQRWWLGGFGAAWASYHDDKVGPLVYVPGGC